MSARWNRLSERRCVCGHDKTLHAYPERRSDGLGACHGQGFTLTEAGVRAACSCARFVTPGQRRMAEYNRRHAEAVREARARLDAAASRCLSSDSLTARRALVEARDAERSLEHSGDDPRRDSQEG